MQPDASTSATAMMAPSAVQLFVRTIGGSVKLESCLFMALLVSASLAFANDAGENLRGLASLAAEAVAASMVCAPESCASGLEIPRHDPPPIS